MCSISDDLSCSYDRSDWGCCWFVVYIRRFIYKNLNGRPFDYTAVVGSGKVGPVNQVNHTSWMAVVTPSKREVPRDVRNSKVRRQDKFRRD